MPRRPVHEVRYGLIVARVWQKKRTSELCYAVTVTRLFRNGSEWKQSTRFAPSDLQLVRHALDQAHTWILQHREAERS